jgi:hypothetical protein
MEGLRNYEIALNLIGEIKKLPDKYKLFLLNIINSDQDASSVNILEGQANDLDWVNVIENKPTDSAVKWLLSYLPLFNNTQEKKMMPVKRKYFILLNRIGDDISRNIKTYSYLLKYECYFLFSLASNHPVFVLTEQTTFKEYADFIKTDLDSQQEVTNQ